MNSFDSQQYTFIPQKFSRDPVFKLLATLYRNTKSVYFVWILARKKLETDHWGAINFSLQSADRLLGNWHSFEPFLDCDAILG